MLATIIMLVLRAAAFYPFSCCATAAYAAPAPAGSLANQTENLLNTQNKIIGTEPRAFVAGSRRPSGSKTPGVRDQALRSFFEFETLPIIMCHASIYNLFPW